MVIDDIRKQISSDIKPYIGCIMNDKLKWKIKKKISKSLDKYPRMNKFVRKDLEEKLYAEIIIKK